MGRGGGVAFDGGRLKIWLFDTCRSNCFDGVGGK